MVPELIRAAGVVVFRRAESGVRLLVLRTDVNWDFPQRSLEAGENDFECAQDELREASGLEDLDFPFGDAHQETLPYAGDRIARYYLAEADTTGVARPPSSIRGSPERELRWVSFDEAEDLLPPRLALVLDWARRTITGN